MPYKNRILDEGELKSINHYKNTSMDIKTLRKMYIMELIGNHMKEDAGGPACPMKCASDMSDSEIYDYYNIIPYRPCWMLNISPNWKGPKCGQNVETCRRVSFIREVMTLFATDAGS